MIYLSCFQGKEIESFFIFKAELSSQCSWTAKYRAAHQEQVRQRTSCHSEILSCCATPPFSVCLEHSWTQLLRAISHVLELGIQVNDLHSFKTLPCECSDRLYFDTFSPCNLAGGTFHLPFNCHGRTAVDFSLKNMISMEINPTRHFSLQPCLITTATLYRGVCNYSPPSATFISHDDTGSFLMDFALSCTMDNLMVWTLVICQNDNPGQEMARRQKVRLRLVREMQQELCERITQITSPEQDNSI